MQHLPLVTAGSGWSNGILGSSLNESAISFAFAYKWTRQDCMLPFPKYQRLGVHEVPAWEGLCFEINDLPAADSVEQMENDLPPLLHKRVPNYMTP